MLFSYLHIIFSSIYYTFLIYVALYLIVFWASGNKYTLKYLYPTILIPSIYSIRYLDVSKHKINVRCKDKFLYKIQFIRGPFICEYFEDFTTIDDCYRVIDYFVEQHNKKNNDEQ